MVRINQLFIIDKKVIFVMIILENLLKKNKNMAQEPSENYSFILIELTKAVKMHNFYPVGHPNLDSALEKCYLLVKKRLEEEPEIKWQVDHKGFYHGKAPITSGNQDVAGLAKKFFFRRIKEITFTKELTLSDMKTLLSALKFEPEDIQAQGGIEVFFADKEVSGILVNALSYEELKKLKDELKEKNEEEALIEPVSEEQEGPAGEAASDNIEKEEVNAEELTEEDLADLLQRIREERDLLKYKDLAVRIRERTEILLAEKKFEEIFPVLMVFYEHSSESGLPEEIRAEALRRLKSFFSLDVLKFLAVRVGNKDESNRVAIQKMLLSAGTEAIEPLLDEITAAQEAARRRNLYNSLVLFGGDLRPFVEKRINSGEWYVARQMVSLLGELGDARSIKAIENAYGYPDERVKKEVLKSLVRIPSPRSTEILIGALGEENQALVNQAIISLGIIKDPLSIDALARVALKDKDLESKKEAIKALGLIGDQKAVPYLTKILFRKVWFGKKSHEGVRSLAAYSLGMIGGPEAYKAIETASKNSEGELFSVCKRILERKERP